MIEGFDTNTVVGSVVAALVAAGVVLRKIYTNWIADGTITVKERATQDVVQMLRDQLHEFEASNKELRKQVSVLEQTNRDMVNETDAMKRQLTNLASENTMLRQEIQALRNQIDRLTELLKGRG